MLVIEDSDGEPLSPQLGAPMEVGSFLSLAISIAIALGKLHRRGLVHKDLKPAHIAANCADGQVRLTGFGRYGLSYSRTLRRRPARNSSMPSNRLDQARLVVFHAANAQADRPADHVLGRVGASRVFDWPSRMWVFLNRKPAI
jgi:serine/threonine protein kinase